ncbi:hypothetical protein ACQKGC_05715 [Allorhizobium pseudoryzae]|uniref:hypothetical protein n=1 Tax=Allorhizobium pseudoryzae TaxID=379684 RepID=UPI003D019C67
MENLVQTRWLPIDQADRSIATVQTFTETSITLRNSYPVWVRDEDGRVFEAVWSEGTASYWWDLDGESPVDPVEFMPHPLDARYQMPTPPGNQIRTAECDGEDAVPVTGQLPVGTASATQIAMSADALCAKAGISFDLIDDGTTQVVLRAPEAEFSELFADHFQPAYIYDGSGGLGFISAEPLAPTSMRTTLDWTGFKGIQRNKEWLPSDQDLIHTAMNVYDGEGDMDDDAREQIIERLLFAWQNAELAAATSNAHRHELLQQVERYRSERPYVVGFNEGFDVASKQREERFVRLKEIATKVCEIEQEFREQMPSDWEGDPITDAVADLKKELVDDVSATSESLERRLAECLSSCIDEPLLKGFLGGDGRIPTTIRLGFFRPEIADKAAELLEEFGI